MYADHDHRGEYAEDRHDHRGEYAEDRHDHDNDYAEKYHRHHGDERTAAQLRQDLAAAKEWIREHGEEIRQLWERVRQLESALQPQPQTGATIMSDDEDTEIPGECDASDRDDWDAANWDAAALLPTGKLMNPARPEDALYYDEDQIAYVVTGPAGSTPLRTRVLTSFGELKGWTLGSEHEIRHDQTARDLGRYVVTGIRNYKTGTQSGDIPDRPVRQWVFKV